MSSFAQAKSLGSPCSPSVPKLDSSSSYVEDVLRSMLNDQSDHVYSKFTDSYIKYRRVVVEWMVDVADYFNLHMTTTHAAIAYLDRLQPNEKYSRFEWQMMAICCLIISSKYNECEEHVPALHKLEEITQQAMTNECVLNYELWALKRMGWKLNARTPMAFLDSYIYLAQRLPEDPAYPINPSSFASPEFYTSVTSLATKCLFDHSFKPLAASAIATGILYYVRETAGCVPIWTHTLSRLTGHDADNSKSVQKVLFLIDALTHNELTLREQDIEEASVTEEMSSETDSAMESLSTAVDALLLQKEEDAYGNDENTPTKAAVDAMAKAKLPLFTTPAVKAVLGEKKDHSPASIADLLA